jgi:hypothetical protein
MAAGEVHPSDAIVAVVGYYAGEVRRVQALLAAQAQGAHELKRQLEEATRTSQSYAEQIFRLNCEMDEIRELIGADTIDAVLSTLKAKLRAASPP